MVKLFTFGKLDTFLSYINFIEQLFVYFYIPSFKIIFWIFFSINLFSSVFSTTFGRLRLVVLAVLEVLQLLLYIFLVPTPNFTTIYISFVVFFTVVEIVIIFCQYKLQNKGKFKKSDACIVCCYTSWLMFFPALTLYMRDDSFFKENWFELVLSVTLFYSTLGSVQMAKCIPIFREWVEKEDDDRGKQPTSEYKNEKFDVGREEKMTPLENIKGDGDGGGEKSTSEYKMEDDDNEFLLQLLKTFTKNHKCLVFCSVITLLVLLVSMVIVGSEEVNYHRNFKPGIFNNTNSHPMLNRTNVVNDTAGVVVGTPTYDFVVSCLVLTWATIIVFFCFMVLILMLKLKFDN